MVLGELTGLKTLGLQSLGGQAWSEGMPMAAGEMSITYKTARRVEGTGKSGGRRT